MPIYVMSSFWRLKHSKMNLTFSDPPLSCIHPSLAYAVVVIRICTVHVQLLVTLKMQYTGKGRGLEMRSRVTSTFVCPVIKSWAAKCLLYKNDVMLEIANSSVKIDRQNHSFKNNLYFLKTTCYFWSRLCHRKSMLSLSYLLSDFTHTFVIFVEVP